MRDPWVLPTPQSWDVLWRGHGRAASPPGLPTPQKEQLGINTRGATLAPSPCPTPRSGLGTAALSLAGMEGSSLPTFPPSALSPLPTPALAAQSIQVEHPQLCDCPGWAVGAGAD